MILSIFSRERERELFDTILTIAYFQKDMEEVKR